MLLCYFLTILYLHSTKVVLERVSTLSGREQKILGTSKIGPKYRITLVKDVQEKLKAKIGDVVLYIEDSEGRIYIRAVSYDQLLRITR